MYDTSTNFHPCAINDAIFMDHVKETHSKKINADLLDHTLLILLYNMNFKIKGKKKEMQMCL